ncbi:MAG: putative iron-regulated protein [Maribacter sp.]|jgi:putative iron-regulated protein
MNFYRLKSSLLLAALIAVSIGIISCDDDTTTTTTSDYSDILEVLGNDVILVAYSDLEDKSNVLLSSVNALKSNPSETNLTTARQAWVDTRKPWEQSEGFLFGPVDTDGIDPALDSWPVNQTDLEAVLASSDNLSNTYVNNLDGTQKGFHTVEFLLFGINGTKQIGDFTDREFDYLIASASILADDTAQLVNAWKPSGGNFINNVVNAGENGSIYISQKSALEELTGGILGIADEVGNGKINDPLAEQNPSLEESQFSNNSKTDFTDNIRSIQNIYEGTSNNGLTVIVAEKNATLDTQIKSEIQAAINAIQAIPGNFTDAILSSSPTHSAALNAQTKVNDLETTINDMLVPLISGL